MQIHKWAISTLAFVSFVTVAHADTLAPFGVASAYNLVALGTIDSHGATVIKGTIGTQADITGRIAAADQVLFGTTIGSHLNADPWGSLATYGMVSTNGLTPGHSFNINGGGSVYAPGTNGNFNFNENPQGSRVTSGSSGIDFNALRTSMALETAQLNGLTANGVVLGTNQPGHNPSWLVLKGTDAALNVFNLTAAQFASNNNNIDIEAPVGSTIIVNVAGVNVTLGTGLYYNGNQTSGDSPDDAKILFNFAGAQTVTISAQFNASILAPFAILSGNGQMAGNFIAAQIGRTGEVHNVEFTGVFPHDPPAMTPEPGTLVLMSTGIMSLAAAVRRKRSAL